MRVYLKPIGPWGQCFAIVTMVAVCAIGSVITAALIASMIEARSVQYQGKPLWVAACVVVVLTAASGWLAVRLLSGRSSANGVTVMPVWFIEAFGGLFLVGMVWLLFTKNAVTAAAGGVGVGLSMLLIRRQVRSRVCEQDNQAPESSQVQPR